MDATLLSDKRRLSRPPRVRVRPSGAPPGSAVSVAVMQACRKVLRAAQACVLALAALVPHTQAGDVSAQRERMLAEIRASVRESAGYTGLDQLSDEVMAAMGSVPREKFVPGAYRHAAYDNTALPIEEGQTISQPLIVALMTELVRPGPDSVILEVGTGSGYQAAVLAELVAHVYSIEIVEELAASAARLLAELDYDNVTVRAGDGYAGWPEHAPFDGIVVTAAAEHVPRPLLDQLKPGGRLVIPVGEHLGYQELMVLEVDAAGEVSRRAVLPVRFVPLTRD